MADIRPFRGIRYSPSQIGNDLSSVVCPPFDVISAQEQEALYQRDPRNIVRIELTRAESGEVEAARYQRAAAQYRHWLDEGTLVQDTRPAIYPCLTSFAVDGKAYQRRGLLALLRLEPWERGIVRPHERTLAKAKADRLQLLHACRANLSPIWVVSRGPQEALARLWQRIEGEEPEAQVSDEARHAFWACRDETVLEELQQAWRELPAYIADGHHRYETALAFRGEAAPVDPEDAANFVLTYFVESTDGGLVVLGLHRLLRWPDPLSTADLNEALAPWFDIEVSDDSPERLVAGLSARPARPGFALWAPNLNLSATFWLKDLTGIPPELATGHSDPWRKLDVVSLHALVIDRLFRPGTTALSEAGQLTFTPSLEEVQRVIRAGQAQVAFLVRSTPIESVLAVADAGDRMPEKSTYFFPKPVTGAVIASLDGRVSAR